MTSYRFDGASIHRQSRDFAELRTNLEIATHQDLAEQPDQIATLFFESYDQFSAHLSGQSSPCGPLSDDEIGRTTYELAAQVARSRYARYRDVVSGIPLLELLDDVPQLPGAADAQVYFRLAYRLIEEALAAENDRRASPEDPE